MRSLLVLCCLTGCLVARNTDPEPTTPSRMLVTLTGHGGLAMVDEPARATDGATASGGEVGVTASVAYRFTPRWAAGVGLDFAISDHDTMVEDRSAGYWKVSLPIATVRHDLGRYALTAWGGYYVGHRIISDPSDSFLVSSVSSVEMRGPMAAIAGVVRMKRANGGAFEVGPYLMTSWMTTTEDDEATQLDEDGLTIRSLSIGLVLQGAFGSPPIAGDRF